MCKAFKRIFSTILTLTLLIPLMGGFSPQIAHAETEEMMVQIRTLYWDVWKHSGGNWQSTGRPGNSKTETFDITPPAQFATGYKNVRFEVKQGPVTQEDNSHPNLEPQFQKNWLTYSKDTLAKSADITNLSVAGKNSVKVGFNMPTPPIEKAENIKAKEEANGQSFAGNVEGYRYYIPVTIYWYGTKDEAPKPEPVPDKTAKGKLMLKAKSQSGKYERPDYEAKWTDWITATLTPTAPTAPRGSLDWWKITDAKLTYPKKNPKFTFGTPHQPVGTLTKPMEVKSGGHEAELKFQEDWSLDGTPIYSMLTKTQMTSTTPKSYPIAVEFTIEYQYSWEESSTSCSTNEDGSESCSTTYWTETRNATQKGTVDTKVKVTGTGVDSKAN